MAGNLDNIRDKSRALVHAQFALPAIVSLPDGSPVGNAQVRLHLADSRPFADLDREGYAFNVEGKTMLVFDTEDFMPAEKQVVNFSRGRVYYIEHIVDNLDRTRYPRCVATEKLS